MRPFRVHVSQPRFLDGLISSLRSNDCICEPLDDVTCAVTHAAAGDEREARLELAFFLKVWQDENVPARAVLVE